MAGVRETLTGELHAKSLQCTYSRTESRVCREHIEPEGTGTLDWKWSTMFFCFTVTTVLLYSIPLQ